MVLAARISIAGVGPALLATALAVGQTANEGQLPGLQRYVQRVPELRLEISEFLREETTLTWDFLKEEDGTNWSVSGQRFVTRQRGDGTLSVQGQAGVLWLAREVDFGAARADSLELDLSTNSATQLLVCWTRRDGAEGPECEAALADRPEGPGGGPVRFEVGRHLGWRGEITSLHLGIRSERAFGLELGRLRAVRRFLDLGRLEEAAGRTWRIELASDVRSGKLGLGSRPVQWDVLIPERSDLVFSYGLLEKSEGDTRFTVSLTTAGGLRVTLFDEIVGASASSARWHDGRVSLARGAGQAGRLEFRVSGGPGSDDAVGVWANPEVVVSEPRGESPPDVVVILIDTLRPDHLSLYGYTLPTSRHLDRFAEDSAVVFEQTITQAPWTFPAHVSLFSGLDAFRHGVNHSDETLPTGLPILAEILREAGFATCAITGGGFLDPVYGVDRGFDSYRHWSLLDGAAEFESGLRQAVDWLRQTRDRPSFLFFHTYEVHYPHQRRQPDYDELGGPAPRGSRDSGQVTMDIPPAESESGFRVGDQQFRWLLPTGERGPALRRDELPIVVAMYDSAVAFVDRGLARLFAEVEVPGGDRSLVIFTSDHGEALGEHGRGGHGYLYESNLKVPLVVALPDRRGGGRRVSEQVRLVDVLPTVLEVVGLDTPPGLDGVSLVHLIDGEPSRVPDVAWSYAPEFNQGLSLRSGRGWKGIVNDSVWDGARGQSSFFYLRQDPEELDDLSATHPAFERVRAEMQQTWEARLAGLRLVIRNPADRTLEGELWGDLVRPSGVKGWAIPEGTVRWVESRKMAFSVDPGQRLALVFEVDGPLLLGIRAGFAVRRNAASDRVEREITIAEDTRGRFLALLDGIWRVSNDDPGPEIPCFELRRVGPWGAAESITILDRAQTRIEALGYVH